MKNTLSENLSFLNFLFQGENDFFTMIALVVFLQRFFYLKFHGRGLFKIERISERDSSVKVAENS